MNFENARFGIFKENALIRNPEDDNKPRTAMLGHIARIEKVSTDHVAVRVAADENTWEKCTFFCPDENLIPISEKIWPFLLAISSPQERLALAKNQEKCEKLMRIRVGSTIAFLDCSVVLGKVRYIGYVTGMGKCFGIELCERKKNNTCNGFYAGHQYFTCDVGKAIFTTIDRIEPISIVNSSPSPASSEDYPSILNADITDSRPPYEEIITKYGEYEYPVQKRTISTPKNAQNYMRTSMSLQNILDVDQLTLNTNNDFDSNSILQPEKTRLIVEKKPIMKSDVDLSDLIGGTWSGTTDKKQLEAYSNLKKNLDKNDNIKDKTLPTRNKSSNIINHIFEKNTQPRTQLRKSRFYVDENGGSDGYMNGNRLKERIVLKNDDTGKKLNERSEQLSKSKFYVHETKFTDPKPGTTNDFVVGSLVEVLNDVSESPLYGVIRWLGLEKGTTCVMAGVELEEEQGHLPLELSNGVYKNELLFRCAEKRALFVPVNQCHKDSRFQDGIPTPVQETTEQNRDCPIIPGAVAPLCMPSESDVEAVCGKYRGIQGHHNSCYLDVTLFSMFTYTSVFDSLLFRPKGRGDITDYEEVQRVLREEIVNPLRKNLFVKSDHVMKLRRLLDKLSSVSGLTCEEKDPEEFLNSLLAQILKADPFLKLNSGQEAFHYQLFVEKNADLTLPTVQQLFEQSFLTSNVKLKEVPSCLIIQMPRFGKSYKVYPRIMPSQLLDVTDVIEGSPRQCFVCGMVAQWECAECFDAGQTGLENTGYCTDCHATTHRHEKRQHHRPRPLHLTAEFTPTMQKSCRPPRIFMELFAVICIETSHYVAFVKCGVGHEAPWCFFDSMADRQGERNGFNIPEMVACPDISRWLADDSICRKLHEENEVDRHLPEHARRLLCDAYICMYQSSEVMMYR